MEETFYSNISTTRITKPAGYPADATNNPNDYVAKVNGSGNKIGPSILLKVMADDKFNIAVSSWYKKNGANPGTPADLLSALVAALAGGVSNVKPMHGTPTQLISSGVLDPLGTWLFEQPDGSYRRQAQSLPELVVFR